MACVLLISIVSSFCCMIRSSSVVSICISRVSRTMLRPPPEAALYQFPLPRPIQQKQGRGSPTAEMS